MPKFFRAKILPYNSKFLFNLVKDIENYPHFLPWCSKAVIDKRLNKNTLLATLVVGKFPFHKSFQSVVFFRESTSIKSISTKDGPFKYLLNIWKFESLSFNLTKVCLFLDFEFDSLFFDSVIKNHFLNTSEVILKAFEKRAHNVYILN